MRKITCIKNSACVYGSLESLLIDSKCTKTIRNELFKKLEFLRNPYN